MRRNCFIISLLIHQTFLSIKDFVEIFLQSILVKRYRSIKPKPCDTSSSEISYINNRRRFILSRGTLQIYIFPCTCSSYWSAKVQMLQNLKIGNRYFLEPLRLLATIFLLNCSRIINKITILQRLTKSSLKLLRAIVAMGMQEEKKL